MIEIWLKAIRDAVLAGVLFFFSWLARQGWNSPGAIDNVLAFAAIVAFLCAINFLVQAILDPWRATHTPRANP